jgi:hypothetical protein
VSRYAIGDRVSQPTYGVGTITSVDEYHTVIDFDEHGPRRFATSVVQLERSKVPAPDKPAKKTTRRKSPARA